MVPADSTPITATSSSPSQSFNSSSPADLHYAFLVHSQKTLTQNLPPRVDNKILARQKRRRTSPEDHAILEAEYKKNPKPDKVSRASIVSQVSLGEKEVQIWFQNRRQNDRRKSKPLEPHELVRPPALDGVSNGSPTSDGTSSPRNGEQAEQPEGNVRRDDEDALADPSSNTDDDELETSMAAGSLNPETSFSSLDSADIENLDTSRDITGLGIQVNGKKRRLSDIGACHGEHNGQLCQEEIRSPPSLRISMSFDGEALLRKEGEPTPSPPKARTAVRISLSSDGEALIRTQDEPSPSKNRLRFVPGRVPRQTSLRRSVSAINFGTPGGSPLAREGNGMKPFGRSRDARMWETYCDNDARSALSTPLSSQPSNSTRTPGLYRSGSHRSAARHSLSKPNFSSPAIGTNNQPDVVEVSREKRRKLSRTLSSLGRLESVQKASHLAHDSNGGLKSFHKAGKEGVERGDLEAGDSDKENWVPGTYRRPDPRRHQRAKSHTQRSVLKENGIRKNTVVDDLALTKHGRLYRGPRGTKDVRNPSQTAAKLDAEVAAFMTKTGSSSREEDLDFLTGEDEVAMPVEEAGLRALLDDFEPAPGPEPVLDPEPEPKPEPEPVLEPEPELDPDPDPEPVPVPEPEPVLVLEPELDPDPDPDPDPEPEPVLEPEPELDPDPEPEPEPVLEPEPALDPEPEPGAEPVLELELDVEVAWAAVTGHTVVDTIIVSVVT
ncbi:uncharacterized protein BHQ10_003649 [Talaromyces amestolkiae]|uniref:Homeobox domain-containing protein n=1 Tax=Talaromyces amestolkiae TaxID=1196081 RepID=A0A364KVQ6_TALAM|nr:uncharacterized protein BHQ10_003649 [Talaromyces amestolkiae]RAO67637.1 hypothetical protein BHQ10_003649 [Talaromyces amestolkiae]